MGIIGRNNPCPCGSGKKYKKCCIDKPDDLEFMNPNNFLKNFKKIKNDIKIKHCLHPNKEECLEKIIKAHSIQNNKILTKISDNGIVVMPFPKNDNPVAIQTEWGRKEATTFTGFCGYHDNELFKPIENYDFDKSEKQVFLHTYRCWALGYHRKLENTNLEKVLLGKRPSLMGTKEFTDMFNGDKLAVNDLEYYKNIFDRCILDDKYDILSYEIWEFDFAIKFASSGFGVLTKDLKGNLLQDLRDFNKNMKHVFCTVFPEGEKSYCIISWLKEDNELFLNYTQQLRELNEVQRKSYINNLIPMESENIAINPTAWKLWTQSEKEEFGSLIWNMGMIFEIMTGEVYDMLQQPSFDLFAL
jgi:hypothetical protein